MFYQKKDFKVFLELLVAKLKILTLLSVSPALRLSVIFLILSSKTGTVPSLLISVLNRHLDNNSPLIYIVYQ